MDWPPSRFASPLHYGLDATQGLGTYGAEDYEMGDLALALKVPLQECDNYTIAAGLGVTLPTARDATYVEAGIPSTDTTATFVIHNDSVHLAPFVGMHWDVTDSWYAYGFAQLDFDANGDASTRRPLPSSPRPTFTGRYFDQDLLYVDLGVGHWLYRNTCAHYLTGIVPTVELHYTTTLQDSNTVLGRQ